MLWKKGKKKLKNSQEGKIEKEEIPVYEKNNIEKYRQVFFNQNIDIILFENI